MIGRPENARTSGFYVSNTNITSHSINWLASLGKELHSRHRSTSISHAVYQRALKNRNTAASTKMRGTVSAKSLFLRTRYAHQISLSGKKCCAHDLWQTATFHSALGPQQPSLCFATDSEEVEGLLWSRKSMVFYFDPQKSPSRGILPSALLAT